MMNSLILARRMHLDGCRGAWQVRPQVSHERSSPSEAEPGDADFFRALAGVLPGAVYQARFSPEGIARVEYMSDAARWLLELEPEAIVRDVTVFRNLIHPEDRERFNCSVDEQRKVSGQWQLEYRLLLPSGRLRWIASQASISVLPDGGALWRGFMTDITERKRAEQDLQAERERLTLAAFAGHIGTWDYDVRSGGILWNDVMYEIHGVTRESYEPQGEKNFQFLPPEDRERVRGEFQRALASRENRYSIDVQLIRPDGERRLTRSHAVIIREPNGEAVRVIGIEMDITEDKRAEMALAAAKEAAEAADRAKSEFLATMSHEIRTPMNGVLGYAALLKSTPLNAEQRGFLDTIEASGEHLLAIINDVLDVSRIDAGGMQIDMAAFDVCGCVREVFEMLRPVAEGKGLAYVCEIAADFPAGMVCDRARLAQVLTNILGNAIKFTDAGEVRLSVSAVPARANGGMLWRFCVADTGPGIAPEALDRIFQPFYQADSSPGRMHGGTGLGLAISRRLAELLGGTLRARNRGGGGSEFLLAISAAAADALFEPKPALSILPTLNGLRILVVEDNPVNRRLCALQLRRIGCDSRFAANGAEAVKQFRETRFDVVLMDMQLPGLDGCQATRQIRGIEQEQNAARTPIVAMTANARSEDRERCLEAGMDDYLSKPLRQEHLAAMLVKWAGACR